MRNPMVSVRQGDMQPVAVDVPISTLAPAASGELFCRLNHEWLLREWWPSTLTKPGDVIEWFDLPWVDPAA